MKVALDAMVKAEDYYKASDLKNVFAVLEKVIPEVKLHEEAYDKVCKQYEKYRNEYIETIKAEIGEPSTSREYGKAVSILRTAMDVLPNDSNFGDMLDDYLEKSSITVLKQAPVSAHVYLDSGKATKEAITNKDWVDYYQTDLNLTDNYSNNYKNAALIRVGHSSYYDYGTPCATRIIYDCSGYNYLKGIFAICDKYKSYAGNTEFKIWGFNENDEGEVIYEFDISSTTRPQEVILDISNYVSFSFKLDVVDSSGEYYAHYKDEVMGIILADWTLSH